VTRITTRQVMFFGVGKAVVGRQSFVVGGRVRSDWDSDESRTTND